MVSESAQGLNRVEAAGGGAAFETNSTPVTISSQVHGQRQG